MTRAAAARFHAGVLAGERGGPGDVARAAGVPAKVLAPVAGEPMLERVVAALETSTAIADLTLCGPAAREIEILPALAARVRAGELGWLPPGASPAASVDALLERLSAPLLATTGDHPLLKTETIDEFCAKAAATGADAVVGLVRYRTVRAAFPASHRTRLRFADADWCGCNLFAFPTARGRRVVEFWRRVEAHRKKPHRLLAALGLRVVGRYLAGRLSLPAALEQLSARTACRVCHVEIESADAAVDVDSLADRELVEGILHARASLGARAMSDAGVAHGSESLCS